MRRITLEPGRRRGTIVIMARRRGWLKWLVLVAALLGGGLWLTRKMCIRTWFKYRVVVPQCPDGEFRQSVELHAAGLRRGGTGAVNVGVTAHYTVAASDTSRAVAVGSFDATLALVDAAGQEILLVPARWSQQGNRQEATVTLPDVPDGDYQLRARVTSRIGTASVDAPLPLYTPARIHVLTDRPLYEPGNTVRFRAVVLRARDLAPLPERPGTWVVTDPSGEQLLEEKAPAGPWGVVAGSFPLDDGAANGVWKVSWRSADATDEVAFTVAPFTLPRFRVETTAQKPFYRPGETPVVTGQVIYSSGAPVANAAVELAWRVNGDWPAPTSWMTGGLPTRTTADGNGRFKLTLPVIPADLSGQVTLSARVTATDATSDRVDSSCAVLLSRDAISASVVTELDGGLVDGFNNRLYLRVTTADGRTLPKASIRVRRAWDPTDTGVDAELDEDGVASLQLDPGPPVNVVIPPQPYRAPPPQPTLTRDSAGELLSGGTASLDDQVALDGWAAALAPCAKWIDGDAAVARLAVRVDSSGAITSTRAGGSPVERCVSEAVRGRRLAAGAPRLYALRWTFSDPQLPKLDVQLESALEAPAELNGMVTQAALNARDCLDNALPDGPISEILTFQLRADAKAVELGWSPNRHGNATSAPVLSCIKSRFAGLVLREPAPHDDMGVVRLHVLRPVRPEETKPQPTVMLGYELEVSAAVDGTPSTRLRIAPGKVPPLRLRATPVFARPGDRVDLELIRGPSFAGALPPQLNVKYFHGSKRIDIDPATRRAELLIEPGLEGWLEIEGGAAHALVYVQPANSLTVAVTPSRPRYAPGQMAELAVETRIAGTGGSAAVGLLGVDESLAQLVPLPGPDDLVRLRPAPTMTSPAFNILDATALAQGRIRGANAAAATVLRVSSVPSVPELDAVVNANAAGSFDPVAVLTDRFYAVLGELHAQTRRWEKSAPPAEKMQPATMAELWNKALAACEQRGEPVEDAFGRRLRLHRLPHDLLALTDPHQVVVLGTRLPEDVESWPAWVTRVRP